MTARPEFDALVVGGGPAGSACSMRLAAQGARVAMVEASDFTPFRIGETLEPAVRSILRRVGSRCDEGEPWGVPCSGIASAWGSSTTTMAPSVSSPYGRGWRVDRRAFDQALFDRASALGAAVFSRARVVEATRNAGRWSFVVARGNEVLAARTPFVVEATGRNGASPFAPSGQRRWLDRLIGVAALSKADVSTESRHRAAAVVESARSGWWYSVRLPTRETLAVFFTDADYVPGRAEDRVEFLKAQLRTTEVTWERGRFIEGAPEEFRVRCFDARSSIRGVAASEGWAATGDALMAFDPLCGQGVTRALGAGLEVADWLLGRSERRPGAPEWTLRAAERFNEYMRERVGIYAVEARWPDSRFWQRRHGSPQARRAEV